jgi:hypothetical protein
MMITMLRCWLRPWSTHARSGMGRAVADDTYVFVAGSLSALKAFRLADGTVARSHERH